MNLSALPDHRAATAPDALALADDRVALDNTGFLATVRRAASMLGEVGVGTGDVVAVTLPDTADPVVAKTAVSIRALDELLENAVGKIDKPAMRRLDARTR